MLVPPIVAFQPGFLHSALERPWRPFASARQRLPSRNALTPEYTLSREFLCHQSPVQFSDELPLSKPPSQGALLSIAGGVGAGERPTREIVGLGARPRTRYVLTSDRLLTTNPLPSRLRRPNRDASIHCPIVPPPVKGASVLHQWIRPSKARPCRSTPNTAPPPNPYTSKDRRGHEHAAFFHMVKVDRALSEGIHDLGNSGDHGFGIPSRTPPCRSRANLGAHDQPAVTREGSSNSEPCLSWPADTRGRAHGQRAYRLPGSSRSGVESNGSTRGHAFYDGVQVRPFFRRRPSQSSACLPAAASR